MSDITIKVTREVADYCLKVVEVWLNKNPDFRIEVHRCDDGRESYRLVELPQLEYKKGFLEEATRKMADELRTKWEKELSDE
ncbi:MAG: hypothetical protein LUH45_05015 [Clostridiales bacterium]|nr:hypothetical protein [Clostridiales bacterium]